MEDPILETIISKSSSGKWGATSSSGRSSFVSLSSPDFSPMAKRFVFGVNFSTHPRNFNACRIYRWPPSSR